MIKPVFTIGASPDALLIRDEVFTQEQGFHDDVEDIDKTAVSLVLYLDENPIATARMFEVDPETYHLGRVAVRKTYRGKKVGTYLVKFMETKARTLGARWIILESQIDKAGFYEKLGYRPMGDGEIIYDQGYPHIMLHKWLLKKKPR
jgi:predicted GNAT family N-acyltransferase